MEGNSNKRVAVAVAVGRKDPWCQEVFDFVGDASYLMIATCKLWRDLNTARKTSLKTVVSTPATLEWAIDAGLPSTEKACNRAASEGRTETIKWAVEKGLNRDQFAMLKAASASGHTDTVVYILKTFEFDPNCANGLTKVAIAACKVGDMVTFEKAIDICVKNAINIRRRGMVEIFATAGPVNNRSRTLMILLRLGCAPESIAYVAAKMNLLDVLKEAEALCQIDDAADAVTDGAVEGGHIHILMRLESECIDDILTPMCVNPYTDDCIWRSFKFTRSARALWTEDAVEWARAHRCRVHECRQWF